MDALGAKRGSRLTWGVFMRDTAATIAIPGVDCFISYDNDVMSYDNMLDNVI